MKFSKAICSVLILPAAGLLLPGCANLKPVTDPVRYFVLQPDAVTAPGSPAPKQAMTVGIGRVQVAEYLQRRQFMVRKDSHEVSYSTDVLWAERLDQSIERVLGLNLQSILGATNVLPSAWRPGGVKVEMHVAVSRFESDPQGRITLEAQWRITNPGGTHTWRTGRSKIHRQGPPPETDPGGAVATLSQSLGDLSRELAAALDDAAASRVSSMPATRTD
jgi:uncharacterized protein